MHIGGIPYNLEESISGTTTRFSLQRFDDRRQQRYEDMCQSLGRVLGGLHLRDPTWDKIIIPSQPQQLFQRVSTHDLRFEAPTTNGLVPRVRRLPVSDRDNADF